MEEFFNLVNRGGLYKPSDLCYVTALHARELFLKVTENPDIKSYIFSQKSSLDAFQALYKLVVEHQSNDSRVSEATCESGHKYKIYMECIVTILFNCMCRNYAKKVNDEIHVSRKRSVVEDKNLKSTRKICKLNSSKT